MTIIILFVSLSIISRTKTGISGVCIHHERAGKMHTGAAQETADNKQGGEQGMMEMQTAKCETREKGKENNDLMHDDGDDGR